MTNSNLSQRLPAQCSVAVIGAGPAGLSVATELTLKGVRNVVVLERETDAGGIPRHCGHIPFGMREFGRCLTGPAYAERLKKLAADTRVPMYTGVTVIEIGTEGRLLLSNNDGIVKLKAERVVLCTGVRETPRSARLVTGQRPLGVLTTGALQSMVYLNDHRPVSRPVIVGTELVAYSALLTCRHAGIKPVAMIEERSRVTAWKLARYFPAILGTRLMLDSQLEAIEGKDRVTAVSIRNSSGAVERIACDGVVFTGQFRPESSLLNESHLQVDELTGGPMVDQYGRCSDPVCFAAGNLLRPVETAGWCWREGKQAAGYIARSLAGDLPAGDALTDVSIRSTEPIQYVMPQRLAEPGTLGGMPSLQLRFLREGQGRLSVRDNSRELWSHSVSALPERRFSIPIDSIRHGLSGNKLDIRFDR